jgi:carbon storage regulator
MQIMTLDFEEPMIIDIKSLKVKVTVFKTPEHGNIKFGVDAPKNMQVNREEIYEKKLIKKQIDV